MTGFSTGSSLGMGFTIMLQSCERVLLSTQPGRTSVVLELSATRPVMRVVGMDTRRRGSPAAMEAGPARAPAGDTEEATS